MILHGLSDFYGNIAQTKTIVKKIRSGDYHHPNALEVTSQIE